MNDPHSVPAREAAGMLFLRLGLGWFLLVWGVNKILAPEHSVKLYSYYHGVDLAAWMPNVMGALEVALALAIILGLFRRFSYGIGFIMHSVTMLVILGEIIAPFVIDEDGYPTNRNQSIAVAAWGAFIALYLLRDRDVWSLDTWIARSRKGNA